MSARPRPTQSAFFADTLPPEPSVEAPAIRSADLKNDQMPSWQRLLASLDPLSRLGRLKPLAFARPLITFSIGVAIALAWQSYGGTGREPIAPAAPSLDQQQLNAMSLDLDAVRQSVDRIAASQVQMTRSVSELTAGQEWMTRDFTSELQAVEQDVHDKISVLPPRSAPAQLSKPAPRPSQAPTVLTPARNP
jgi:hypothetical protein